MIAIAWFSGAAAGLSSGLLAALFVRVEALPRPVHGRRGLERSAALGSPLFARVEPAIAFVAALLSRLNLEPLRARTELRLSRSGTYLGLCADELFALSLLSAGAFAALGAAAAAVLHASTSTPLLLAVVGAALPFERLRNHARLRARRITRQLPATIDLLALCMNAGLDFIGALELVVRELRDPRDPLLVELRQLLSELALGQVRARALANLMRRAPASAVEEFCTAVIQAEQAGSPLVAVLAIQARMLRMRRSVAAEEAAAHASVLLVLPMVLLLSAVVLVMLGPFIVNGIGL